MGSQDALAKASCYVAVFTGGSFLSFSFFFFHFLGFFLELEPKLVGRSQERGVMADHRV